MALTAKSCPLITLNWITKRQLPTSKASRHQVQTLGPITSFSGVSLFVAPSINNKFELIFGLLGIICIIGITIYDQRNNMIYDRLARRAAFLEMKMGFLPIATDITNFGGAFSSRPHRRTIFKLPIIWHDLALAIIYTASFFAWVFIFSVGLYHRWGLGLYPRIFGLVGLTTVYFFLYLYLAIRNDLDNKSIHESAVTESNSEISNTNNSTET